MSAEVGERLVLVVHIICEGCGAGHGIEEFSPKAWRWQPMAPDALKEELAQPRWCDDCDERTLARVATVSWVSPAPAEEGA